MRIVWITFGLTALVLGAIGAVLPLLPTVPFLLLAAFCFARSSDRLHTWLITHPTFGPPIQNWHQNGAISRRAKVLATLSIGVTLGVSFLLGVSQLIILIQIVTLGLVLLFIWTRPEASR